jgi:hypothetical protein
MMLSISIDETGVRSHGKRRPRAGSRRHERFHTLRQLDRNYVRSADMSDVRWYMENLAEDFLPR